MYIYYDQALWVTLFEDKSYLIAWSQETLQTIIQEINVVISTEYDFRICVFQAEQDSFQFGSKRLYIVDAIAIFWGVHTHFQLSYLLSDQFLWFVQIDVPKPRTHFWYRDRLLQNCHLHVWSNHRGYYTRVFCHDKSSYIHQFELRISQTFCPANSLEYK